MISALGCVSGVAGDVENGAHDSNVDRVRRTIACERINPSVKKGPAIFRSNRGSGDGIPSHFDRWVRLMGVVLGGLSLGASLGAKPFDCPA